MEYGKDFGSLMAAFSPGEFVLGDTAITTRQPSLQYRGYRISDLARHADFPEVAWLLLEGDLPTLEQVADLEAILAEDAGLEPATTRWLQDVPVHVAGLDVVRTAVSLQTALDPLSQENAIATQREKAFRLLAKYPVMAAAAIRGELEDEIEYQPELGYAGNFLRLATGVEADDLETRACESLLIVAADNEYEPSALAARMAAGARADLGGAAVAALSVFNGECALDEVRAIADLLDVAHSPEIAQEIMRRLWDDRAMLPGFAPAQPAPDARLPILETISASLAEDSGEPDGWHQRAQWLAKAAWDIAEHRPTLAWSATRIVRGIGLSVDATPLVLSVGRMAGWLSHYMEQLRSTWKFRARGQYIGPRDLEFRPMTRRG